MIGVRLDSPLAGPVIGMAVTTLIFAIVWQSTKAVIIRMLDGIGYGSTTEIRHATAHVPSIREVLEVRAR